MAGHSVENVNRRGSHQALLILRLAAEDAIKRQKPDEALNDYELGIEADPTWAQGWFNAALLAGELGFFADAADHMQSYLELLPNAQWYGIECPQFALQVREVVAAESTTSPFSSIMICGIGLSGRFSA